MIYIDQNQAPEKVTDLLRELSWIPESESVTGIEIAGEGNMNIVLRVVTNKKSFILKQSRPYVQKYPQVEAPLERIKTEYAFYKTVRNEELQSFLPGIIGYNALHHLIMMEDLGKSPDLTSAYNSGKIEISLVEKLIAILSSIHTANATHDFPENMALRKLNHAHIFVLPFEETNGFNLDDVQPGLQELSLRFKNDDTIKSIVSEIGERYLSPGKQLLHGDYYPGSWLYDGYNIHIIDPEFSFLGFVEYDLGVMAAHLYMITRKEAILEKIVKMYNSAIDHKIYHKMAGIEITRRLIGLAQLPLNRTLDEKKVMLDFAHKLITT